MHNFKELNVWKIGIDLVTDIYQITNTFPKSETFGLTSQIRRSAISIPSNIAEGAGKSSKKDFSRFLEMAYSSSCELETQLIIANKLAYLDKQQFNLISKKLISIQKMLYKLINSMR